MAWTTWRTAGHSSDSDSDSEGEERKGYGRRKGKRGERVWAPQADRWDWGDRSGLYCVRPWITFWNYNKNKKRNKNKIQIIIIICTDLKEKEVETLSLDRRLKERSELGSDRLIADGDDEDEPLLHLQFRGTRFCRSLGDSTRGYPNFTVRF